MEDLTSHIRTFDYRSVKVWFWLMEVWHVCESLISGIQRFYSRTGKVRFWVYEGRILGGKGAISSLQSILISFDCRFICICHYNITPALYRSFYRHVAWFPTENSDHRIFVLSVSEVLGHTEGPAACFVVASCRGLSEECKKYDVPYVCQYNGQTEAEKLPAWGGREDALLRRMPPHLTCPVDLSLQVTCASCWP